MSKLGVDLPFVTLSYAQSLDGTIGIVHPAKKSHNNGVSPFTSSDGYKAADRLILSGDESMKMTHALRANHDAIMVGIGTVLADDPQLNVRYGVSMERKPIPVVLDSSLRTPLNCKLVSQARDRALKSKNNSDLNLLILTSYTSLNPSESNYSPQKAAALQELSSIPGVCVVPILSTSDTSSRVPLMEAFKYLRRDCGFETVMVEGGARLMASILNERIVSHIVLTIAPSFIPGGVKVESLPLQTLGNRFDLLSRNTFKLGDDLVVTGISKSLN